MAQTQSNIFSEEQWGEGQLTIYWGVHSIGFQYCGEYWGPTKKDPGGNHQLVTAWTLIPRQDKVNEVIKNQLKPYLETP